MGFSVVHGVDGHSNKSSLIPPPLIELERLAHRAHALEPETAPSMASSVLIRNLRRRLPPQVIAEMVARYLAGEDTPALSRAYGISKTGLLELLQAEGVSKRRQAITPDDAERALQLYEGGLTIMEVAGRVGYSYGTIRRALHEHGVAMRPSGIRKHSVLDQRA